MIARAWYRTVGSLGGRAAGWRSRVDSVAPSPRRGRLPLGVLALLAVSAAVFAAIGYFHYTVADQRTEQVRESAAEQAGKLTARVLTYQADTVDADVLQAKTHLTGEFLASYSKLTAETIIPQAKQSHIDARWEVSGTSLISAAPDSASVLVLLRGLTTNSTKPDPTYLVSSVRVQVVRPHGRWLIDRMEPL